MNFSPRAIAGAIVGAIDKKIARDLDTMGRQVVARAQALAHVRTGAMRAGIGYEVNGRTLTIISSSPHGLFVEMGTRRNRPYPYIRPALNSVPLPWGGHLELSYPSTPSYTAPIYAHKGGFVLPGRLSRGQRRHVAEHLLPASRALYTGNVRRARLRVGHPS